MQKVLQLHAKVVLYLVTTSVPSLYSGIYKYVPGQTHMQDLLPYVPSESSDVPHLVQVLCAGNQGQDHEKKY